LASRSTRPARCSSQRRATTSSARSPRAARSAASPASRAAPEPGATWRPRHRPRCQTRAAWPSRPTATS
jgi:hypothetical protein